MQTKVLSDHGIALLKSVAIGRPIEHVERLLGLGLSEK